MIPSREPGLHGQETTSSREVSTMAATIDIEIESGVYTDPIRRHRGYYAGDFSQLPFAGESD
jgi:hypothetical protein